MKPILVGTLAIALSSNLIAPAITRADSGELELTRSQLESTRSELESTRSQLWDIKRELEALRYELRRIRFEPKIRKTYQEALGREPEERELSYWINQAASSSSDQMIASHLDWLTRGDGQKELPQIIRRAYQASLKREPNPEELATWVNRVKLNRETYAQIVQALRASSFNSR
jgi:predicted nuclease with TOPRIM domain